MLPSVKLSILLPVSPVISALKFCTLSLGENGANETPRYQEMVGMGLPEEKQAMLTESPSCIVTVPFRFRVAGAPAVKKYICIYDRSKFKCLHKYMEPITIQYQNLIQSHLQHFYTISECLIHK